jgi:hypothetical protein
MVTRPGLEPGIEAPKAPVLPLHHRVYPSNSSEHPMVVRPRVLLIAL